MELRHFRYFIAVAEELHFARAAERLGVTPPTLTVQIQEIERTLGARLLDRTRRAVSLTPVGQLFLTEARGAVAQFDRATLLGRQAGRGVLGRLALGYVGTAALTGVLQERLRLFRARWPEVSVQAQELPMASLPVRVAEGKLDIALIRGPMDLPSGLRTHLLKRDGFCAALPADHPLALSDAPVPAKALAQEALIVPEQDAGVREVVRRGGFTPRAWITPGNLVAVLGQVSLGVGVAIVPDVLPSVVVMPGVVYRPIAGAPIPSEVLAVSRRRERESPAANFILQIAETVTA